MDDEGRTLERVQELTEALQALEEGHAKETAEDLVGAIVDLYGEGLARIMRALPEDTPARRSGSGWRPTASSRACS